MELSKLTRPQLSVIARIQNSMPKEWLNNITHKEKATPVVDEIIDKALADPDVSQETKDNFKLLKDSGYLNREKDVENTKYTKLIDDYVDRELKKAIARGELPKKAKITKNIKRLTKLKNG